MSDRLQATLEREGSLPVEPAPVRRLGGLLVAVCGLTGGAGTTTLAYLLARAGARSGDVDLPVLVAELRSAAGGLAALVGQSSRYSLEELGALARAGTPPRDGVVLELEPGLRAVAPAPALPTLTGGLPVEAALSRVLRDAMDVHGLVVVDCGTLRAGEARETLELASHIVWVAPADPLALRQATALLGSTLAPAPGLARELLALVGRRRRRPLAGAAERAGRQIAAGRCERLVLIPELPALAQGELDDDGERLERALAPFTHFLRGPR